MQPRSSFDRTRLILIAIDAVAILVILVIGWIFLTRNLGKPSITPTAIPSSVSPLETETLTATQSPSATATQDEISPTATEISPEAPLAFPVETLPSTSILITETLPPPSATPTPDRIQPLRAGKYDDTNPNIAYGMYWTILKNPGTKNAYEGTIHFSDAIGNEASFRFTGKGFLLGYQRGKNFGIVTVIIDDQSYSFDEEAFDLVWRSPKLSEGDHFVRIIHESGQSIDLDYVEILP